MKLGQKVTIQSRMVRRNDWRHIGGENFRPRVLHKEWFSVPVAPREVIVIGRRTIKNGYNSNLGDEGIAWIAEKFIPVFLVVESMNRVPFYVLASDLEPKVMP